MGRAKSIPQLLVEQKILQEKLTQRQRRLDDFYEKVRFFEGKLVQRVRDGETTGDEALDWAITVLRSFNTKDGERFVVMNRQLLERPGELALLIGCEGDALLLKLPGQPMPLKLHTGAIRFPAERYFVFSPLEYCQSGDRYIEDGYVDLDISRRLHSLPEDVIVGSKKVFGYLSRNRMWKYFHEAVQGLGFDTPHARLSRIRDKMSDLVQPRLFVTS